MNFLYKKATLEELNYIWDKNIATHPLDQRWVYWKQEYIEINSKNKAATFLVLHNGTPIGEATLILSTECGAVKGKDKLCNGIDTGNINALRIEKSFESQGHISKLIKELEAYSKKLGLTQLTIGVEACESRNLGIYLHWGYNELVMSEMENNKLVLYYGKRL